MLGILCNLLNSTLKVKNRMVARHRMCVSMFVLVVYPHDREADWELFHKKSIKLSITSPGRDKISKFNIQFLLKGYHFHTIIKLKNPR